MYQIDTGFLFFQCIMPIFKQMPDQALRIFSCYKGDCQFLDGDAVYRGSVCFIKAGITVYFVEIVYT